MLEQDVVQAKDRLQEQFNNFQLFDLPPVDTDGWAANILPPYRDLENNLPFFVKEGD